MSQNVIEIFKEYLLFILLTFPFFVNKKAIKPGKSFLYVLLSKLYLFNIRAFLLDISTVYFRNLYSKCNILNAFTTFCYLNVSEYNEA